MISAQVSALLRKELRQLSRSRAAMASSTLLPLLLIVIVPTIQLVSLQAALSTDLPRGSMPAELGDLNNPMLLFTRLLLPMFITLGGVLGPSVTSLHTVVAERERRSLELLMALPVRVQDILAAKILAMLIVASLVALPLYAIDATALLVLGLAGVGYVLSLLLVLFAALLCSIGLALLVALLARDFRTANNVNGILMGPLILATVGILLGVPGVTGLLALAAMLLALGGLTFVAAQRWLSFERYLS